MASAVATPVHHGLIPGTNTESMRPIHRQKKRKVAVLGSRSVGKSTLIVRYVENAFVESYYPTIENTFSKALKYKGDEYDLEIIDTAGQDEYSILNSRHAIGTHGFVLVYSIASRPSWEMVKIVHEKIKHYTGETMPCVIVGQKSDLAQQRQVSTEEAEAAAKAMHAAFIETSARHNDNVDKVFDLVLRETERGDNPAGPEPSKCLVM